MRQDGSRLWIRVSTVPIDPTDLTKGLAGTFEDITADQVPYTSCLPLVLDVPEERSLGMRLYPNPASSSVTVSGVRPGAQFRLRDLHGRLVLVSALQDPGIVSLAGIHPGVYVAEIGGRHSKLIIE